MFSKREQKKQFPKETWPNIPHDHINTNTYAFRNEIMTTQSGFILSRFDVYSVAKCIITVKFLISKFAHFDSMKVSNDHHAQHHRRRRRHRWQQSQRTSAFSCIHRNNDHTNSIAQRFHPVSDYCSDKIEAFCTKFISVMLMEYKDATQQKKNDGGPETKY